MSLGGIYGIKGTVLYLSIVNTEELTVTAPMVTCMKSTHGNTTFKQHAEEVKAINIAPLVTMGE